MPQFPNLSELPLSRFTDEDFLLNLQRQYPDSPILEALNPDVYFDKNIHRDGWKKSQALSQIENPDFWREFVKASPDNLHRAPFKMRNQKEIAIEAIVKLPQYCDEEDFQETFINFSEELRADRNIVNKAIDAYSENFEKFEFMMTKIDPALLADREIALKCITTFPSSLTDVDVSFRNDFEAVAMAVREDGSMLKYASHALRNNDEIVKLAIRAPDCGHMAMNFASKRIKEMIGEQDPIEYFKAKDFSERLGADLEKKAGERNIAQEISRSISQEFGGRSIMDISSLEIIMLNINKKGVPIEKALNAALHSNDKESIEWATSYINTKNLADKLDLDLTQKSTESSKAQDLLSGIHSQGVKPNPRPAMRAKI